MNLPLKIFLYLFGTEVKEAQAWYYLLTVWQNGTLANLVFPDIGNKLMPCVSTERTPPTHTHTQTHMHTHVHTTQTCARTQARTHTQTSTRRQLSAVGIQCDILICGSHSFGKIESIKWKNVKTDPLTPFAIQSSKICKSYRFC